MKLTCSAASGHFWYCGGSISLETSLKLLTRHLELQTVSIMTLSILIFDSQRFYIILKLSFKKRCMNQEVTTKLEKVFGCASDE